MSFSRCWRIRYYYFDDCGALSGLDGSKVEVADLEAVRDEIQIVRIIHWSSERSFGRKGICIETKYVFQDQYYEA